MRFAMGLAKMFQHFFLGTSRRPAQAQKERRKLLFAQIAPRPTLRYRSFCYKFLAGDEAGPKRLVRRR